YGGKHGITPENGPPAYDYGTDTEVWDAGGIPATWQSHIAAVGYFTDGVSGSFPPGATPPEDGFVGLDVSVDLGTAGGTTITVYHTYGANTPLNQGGEPGPINDNCADALVVNSDVVLDFDTTDANTDGPNDPANPCNSANDDTNIWKDIWYRYDAPASGVLTISTCNLAPFDTKIIAYGTTSCDPQDLIDNTILCNEDCDADPVFFTSELVIDVIGGTSTLVRIGGFSATADEAGAEFGPGQVSFTLATGNDTCDLAEDIAPGEQAIVDLGDDTIDDAPICGIEILGAGAWYRVIGNGNTFRAETCASFNPPAEFFDTNLHVYCGPCDDLGCVADPVASDNCGLLNESLSWCTQPGAEYYILVSANGPSPPGQVARLDVFDEGTPCEEPALCDVAGCADPASQAIVLNQVPLLGPSVLGVTMAPAEEPTTCEGDTDNDGVVSVLDTINVILAWGTADPDADVNNDGIVDVLDLNLVILNWGPCQPRNTILALQLFDGTIEQYDTDLNLLQVINHSIGAVGTISGIAYDGLNNTIWLLDATNNIVVENTLDGVATGNSVALPSGGLPAGIEIGFTTGHFFYVDIVDDQVWQVNRAGDEIQNYPQTCIDEGEGSFGNSLDVLNDRVEVLVGPLDSENGTADRTVPVVGSGRTPEATSGPVTGLLDVPSTFISSFVRNRADPNGSMFVAASGGDLLLEIDPADIVPVCGPGNGDCCAANGTPGCEDEECCEAVCGADPFCCDTEWDQICADAAADACEICAP
ncbi:MAG: hypothetical protein ACYTGC_17945, partial [Planctomycetota bacterium]